MSVLVGFFSALFIFPFFGGFVLSGNWFLHSPQVLWPFAIGTAAGIVIETTILRKIPTLENFEHEITHAFVALLFFRRVDDIIVTQGGGRIWHSGGFGGEFGDDMIGLSPYFLPTFTLLSALVRPFLGKSAFPWFDVWLGFTFGFHLWSTIEETRESWTCRSFIAEDGEYEQSDIGRRGLIYSAIVIMCFALATHGLTLALITKGYRGVPIWARQVRRGVVAEINFSVNLANRLAEKIPLRQGRR